MTEPLRYLSLFSGIGGFDLGFDRAGMECAGQVEYDAAARSVLARHWPDVKRMNDVREVQGDEFGAIDVICGGFPCQDVSVAGRREGLAGERSGLWFEFRRIVDRAKPRWVVVENVPGLLSSHGGRDFATVVRGLVECGYGVAWRILDAQYFGVPQRRRRVFIVGSLGDGRAAEVLFEREGGGGDIAPGRGQRSDATGCLAPGARPGGFNGNDADRGMLVTHSLTAVGCDASEDGTGRGVPILAAPRVARQAKGGFTDPVSDNIICTTFNGYTGGADDNDAQGGHLVFDWQSGGDVRHNVSDQHTSALQASQTPAVLAFTERTRAEGATLEAQENLAYALCNPGAGARTSSRNIAGSFGVRRLTPVECERLQGFPIKEESIIIEVCTDPQKTFAHVGILSHKLPKLAGSAGKNKWFERARYAVRSLNQSAQSGSELVLNDVLIFCGERQVEIHSRGKCYLSVNFADGKNSFPPLMQSGDFALLVAGLNTIAARIIRTGKAESLVNAPALTHLQNGEQPAVRYGSVTIPLANVAEFDSTARSGLLKSITSNPSDTPINERTLITLYSSVLSAISGHIPNETLFTNSPRIEIASSFGWTFPQSDSARYRQLGNAVAVPVAEWLGRRIVAAEMEVNPQ